MARRKKHTPEQVVNGADVLPLAQGVRRSAGGPGAAAEKAGVGERKAEAAGEWVELGEAGVEGHRLGSF